MKRLACHPRQQVLVVPSAGWSLEWSLQMHWRTHGQHGLHTVKVVLVSTHDMKLKYFEYSWVMSFLGIGLPARAFSHNAFETEKNESATPLLRASFSHCRQRWSMMEWLILWKLVAKIAQHVNRHYSNVSNHCSSTGDPKRMVPSSSLFRPCQSLCRCSDGKRLAKFCWHKLPTDVNSAATYYQVPSRQSLPRADERGKDLTFAYLCKIK